MTVWQTYGVGLHECFHKLQSEQKVIAYFGLARWRFVVKLHGGSVPEHGNFSSSFDFVSRHSRVAGDAGFSDSAFLSNSAFFACFSRSFFSFLSRLSFCFFVSPGMFAPFRGHRWLNSASESGRYERVRLQQREEARPR